MCTHLQIDHQHIMTMACIGIGFQYFITIIDRYKRCVMLAFMYVCMYVRVWRINKIPNNYSIRVSDIKIKPNACKCPSNGRLFKSLNVDVLCV